MEAAGGELLVVLCGAAVCSTPQLMAYALLVASSLPAGAVIAGMVLPEEAAAPREQQQQVATPVAQQEVDQLQVMASVVQDTIREVLGAAPGSAIPENEPLMLAGVNSTAAVAVTQRLQSALGVDLPATLVFDHPTVRDISEYLADSYAGAALPAAAVPAAAAAGGSAAGGGMEARAAAEQLVMSTVRDLLGLPPGQQGPDAGTPLMVAGLNSTAAVAFTSRLAEALGGVTLPPTLVFDYPSGQAIADYLVEADLMPAAPAPAPAAVAAAPVTRPRAVSRAPAAAGVMAPPAAAEVVLVVASAHRQAGGGLQDIFRGEGAERCHA
jgi:acyl carrier protein